MNTQLHVLDLFSGLEGWASPIRAAGHHVVTLDLDPRFGADHIRDILSVRSLAELEVDGAPFDLILASPPCEAFSTGSIGRHWTGGARAYLPKSEAAVIALAIVDHLFRLVAEYIGTRNHDARYVIENPRGVMRKVAPRPPTGTTWYCQWGERRAKPTDLWTNLADLPLPACHNGAPDHDAQSRYYWKRKALGQTGGTQGLPDAATRALIPTRLSETVLGLAVDHLARVTDG